MLTESDSACARSSKLLANLPEELGDRVLKHATSLRLERGQMLFRSGDRADSFFVVVEGWIKLFRTTLDGAEAVVEALTIAESFAEPPAFCEEPYPVSAKAATDARVVKVPMRGIRDEMRRNPDLALAALASSYRFLQRMVTQIERLDVQTGPQRMAAFLLGLTSVDQGGCEVQLPHEKQLLAGRLGMTPESLSRGFARLREHGVRVRRDGAEIEDVQVLRRFASAARQA